jgi:alpha-1,3-glucosyltransferase
MQHFLLIAATVIVCFGVLWLPFCFAAHNHESGTCVPAMIQVLHRIFPFSRGIFEDKVSNLWYVLSVAVDVRSLADTSVLLHCALALTCLLLLPVGISIWSVVKRGKSFNNPLLLLLALVCSALSFFLASFQVHEKSLLLALVPAALILPYEPLLVCWFQVLGMFTMYPLLLRDKLGAVYTCCIIVYLRLIINYYGASPPSRFQAVKLSFIILSFLGMFTLHVLWHFKPPPAHYPDLYPALFSLYGALNLVIVYTLCCAWLLQAAGAVNLNYVWEFLATSVPPGGLDSSSGKKKKTQ